MAKVGDEYSLAEIVTACGSIDWTDLLHKANDTNVAAVLLRDEPIAVKKIASEAGEADSEPVYVVVQINGKLYKQTGVYESHYGTRWHGSLSEVVKTERMVTFYEKVAQLGPASTRRNLGGSW